MDKLTAEETLRLDGKSDHVELEEEKMTFEEFFHKYVGQFDLDFKKNTLINSILDEFYFTFAKTQDTVDYVSVKNREYIQNFIGKNMVAKFKEVNKIYKQYLKFIKKQRKLLKKKQRLK